MNNLINRTYQIISEIKEMCNAEKALYKMSRPAFAMYNDIRNILSQPEDSPVSDLDAPIKAITSA